MNQVVIRKIEFKATSQIEDDKHKPLETQGRGQKTCPKQRKAKQSTNTRHNPDWGQGEIVEEVINFAEPT